EHAARRRACRARRHALSRDGSRARATRWIRSRMADRVARRYPRAVEPLPHRLRVPRERRWLRRTDRRHRVSNDFVTAAALDDSGSRRASLFCLVVGLELRLRRALVLALGLLLLPRRPGRL